MENKSETIFENEDFIIINKPAGMLSVPDRMQSALSVKDILKKKYGEIFTVHRLDKATSGLIIFAKNAESHKTLSQLFESREVEKFYLGLVKSNICPQVGTIDAAIIEHPTKKGLMTTNAKGKMSITDYSTIDNFKNYSLVQFQIHTGRTHQIRVHLQHIGHQLIGDDLYGDGKSLYLSSIKRKFKLSKDLQQENALLARLALHSYKLRFIFNKQKYSFECPLHKDFEASLTQLRKWNK